jgi:phosphatidylglycerophosphate synthase
MRSLAKAIAARGIDPNTISLLSMIFALCGAICLAIATTRPPSGTIVLLLVAAVSCQLRLLCNLIDGMVAVEGGLGRADGVFWNEVPDRVSDFLLLFATGIAAGVPSLGALAAAGAILTAYVREFGRAEGLTPDFRGPMAKPQRMALLTAGLVIAATGVLFDAADLVLQTVLWVILIGTIWTSVRRATGIVRQLRSRS